MSLHADDLKRLFERADLEYRAGIAVCTSADSLVDEALAAARQAVEPAGAQNLTMLHLLVILGSRFAENLRLRSIQDGARAVAALLPGEAGFHYRILVDHDIDGALMVALAGVPRRTPGEGRRKHRPGNR